MLKDELKKLCQFEIDITYQDTDIAGVVYFANYFNYGEKARSKIIKGLFGKTKFSQEQNWAVKNVRAEYLKPCTIDEIIVVKTAIKELKLASLVFLHNFYVNDALICKMEATLFSINKDLKPARISTDVYEMLSKIYNME